MEATDVEEYAAIVQHTYGEGAQEFARRMAARFAGSDTEVELFWRTVDENLARSTARQAQPAPTPAPRWWHPLQQLGFSAAAALRNAVAIDPAMLKRPVARTPAVSSP